MEYGINYGSDGYYLAIHMMDITKTAHQMYITRMLKSKYAQLLNTNNTYEGHLSRMQEEGENGGIRIQWWHKRTL